MTGMRSMGDNGAKRIKHNFVKRLCQFVKIDEKNQKYKQISLDKYECESKNEWTIKSISDGYDYLLNNINQCFCENIIVTSYFIITKSRINRQVIKKIIDYYYLNIDEPICELAADIYYIVSKSKLKRKKEFGFLLMSYLLMRKGLYPVIILKNDYYMYKRAIKDFQESKFEWKTLVQSMEYRTRRTYQNNHESITMSKEELIKIILDNKEVLEHKYKVAHLYLFGSFSNDDYKMCSDIDFRVTFHQEWEASKIELIYRLHSKLQQLFKVKIDLVETTEGLNSYLKNKYEKHIKIY